MENNPAQPPSPDQIPPQEPPVQDSQIPPVPQNPTPSETNPQSPPPNNGNSDRTIIAILLLLFVYPIGLIFMWFGTKWPKWVKFLITAPIILAILGIALAIFLVSLDPSHKIEEARSRVVKSVTPTPDPTANWKIYENSTIGISFKYPSGDASVSQTDNNYYIDVVEQKHSPFPTLHIEALRGDEAATKEAYLNSTLSGAKVASRRYSSVNKINVGGEQFYYYTSLFDPTTGALPPVGGPDTPFVAQAKINGVFYSITFTDFTNSDASSINTGWAEEEKQFKQILSTFKFTNSPKETLDKFYKAYLSCLNAETNPEDLFSASYKCYEQFIKDPEIDQAFEKSNLANLKANFSSLICSSNIPESISFGQAEIKDKNAKVIATRIYKEGIRSEEKPFAVDLISESGIWKINNIICQ